MEEASKKHLMGVQEGTTRFFGRLLRRARKVLEAVER